jgi:catechol 2,3-dioxygenase-like lactoylglutathione lyase family enzyme
MSERASVPMLTALDHVTLVTRSLPEAVRTYRALLGAAPSWQGSHPDLATDAAIFPLSNALLEIVAPQPGAPEAEGLRGLVASRGESLHSLTFRTDDASAFSGALRARGVRATPPQPGEARGDDGTVRAYRTVDLSPRSTRGLPVLAVERPSGPDLRDRPEPAADSVDALDHVVVRTSDASAALTFYGETLGLRLALDRVIGATRMLFFRVGGVTIEIVEDPAAGPIDTFGGLAYRVRDLEAAHARLGAGGFALSEVRAGAKSGTHVFTVRGGTCGVPTLMLRDPARD